MLRLPDPEEFISSETEPLLEEANSATQSVKLTGDPTTEVQNQSESRVDSPPRRIARNPLLRAVPPLEDSDLQTGGRSDDVDASVGTNSFQGRVYPRNSDEGGGPTQGGSNGGGENGGNGSGPRYHEECYACPVGTAFMTVRSGRPEAVDHVLAAARELTAAMRSVMESIEGGIERTRSRPSKVERIKL